MCIRLDFSEKIDSVRPDQRKVRPLPKGVTKSSAHSHLLHHQVIIASQAVCESEALVKFLKLVLFVGNYMNSGSSDAGTHGFKLSFLTKLKDTKTTNGKQSLLHFIVNLVSNQSEDLWGLATELASTGAAASVDSSNVNAEVQKLASDVSKVWQYLQDRGVALCVSFLTGKFRRSTTQSNKLKSLIQIQTIYLSPK